MRTFGIRSVLAVIVVLGTMTVPAAAAAEPDPRPICSEAVPTELEALEMAARCGGPIGVLNSYTEFERVLAQPDGRLSVESGVLPQQARKSDGQWAAVDLTLFRDTDGMWKPKVSAAAVAFSNGGSGPFAGVTVQGKTLRVGWPGTLPAPSVTGDALTYANVLPDVDLVVSATRTGFTHVVVVKTPAAAANPAVRHIPLALSGDAQIDRESDGTVRARVGELLLATASPATMWDSAIPSGPDSGLAKRSTATGPGDAAHYAKVATDLSGTTLGLTPDPAMLSTGQFPLYVDPPWSVGKSRWAYATNNNSTNTDYSVARIGKSPESGAVYRSFFEFPTTGIRGKHIESAYIQMKLDHSWSCGDTRANLYLVPALNAAPKASWTKMGLTTFMSSALGHANEAGGCGVVQPDMIMNFTGSGVTAQAQRAATSWPSLTVAFSARDSSGSNESATDRWKKFFPGNAKLIVDYDSKPGIPNGLRIAGVACGSVATGIGILNPAFSAVYPDADTGQSLGGTYEWIEVPAGGIGTVTDTAPARKTPPPVAPAAANGRGTTAAISGLISLHRYAFRVKAKDPAPYDQWSGWSPWCEFIPDTTAPPAPAIATGPVGGPGTPTTFTFTVTQGAGSAITKFRYGFVNPPSTEVAATGTTTKTASVTVVMPKYGHNIMWVQSVNGIGSLSLLASADITVGRPSPPIARWGLESYPGVTSAQALADQQPALGGNTPLTAAGDFSWAGFSRIRDAQVATFTGVTGAGTQGALSAGPVVTTTATFSVSAWVRLSAVPASDMKVVVQEGSDAPGFELGVRRSGSPLVPYWSFLMKDTAAMASTTRAALAPTAITSADVGRWIHLAGVYDKVANKVRLYVNGVLVNEADRPVTPWAAGGRLVVGRSATATTPANLFLGSIADVQIHDRALVAQDFTGVLQSDPLSGGFDEPGILTPIQVGRWSFNGTTPCYLADLENTCEAPDGGPFGRFLALTRGSDRGAGRSGSGGLALDGQYFPDENPPPAETTQEYGRTAIKSGVDTSLGYPRTVWTNRAVLNTGESFTVSVWAAPSDISVPRTVVSQVGTAQAAYSIQLDPADGRWHFVVSTTDLADRNVRFSADSVTPVEAGAWVHLVGVHDAATNTIKLYVNGGLEDTTVVSPRVVSVSNATYVGRSLLNGAMANLYAGGIDDLVAYAGAMNDAQVKSLYDAQSAQPL